MAVCAHVFGSSYLKIRVEHSALYGNATVAIIIEERAILSILWLHNRSYWLLYFDRSWKIPIAMDFVCRF
jgi:hypothetical protein